jgi:ABC-type uncharacterized transport system permease subunit
LKLKSKKTKGVSIKYTTKIIVAGVILTVFATGAQTYSGQEFGNNVTGVIRGTWNYWISHFWVG